MSQASPLRKPAATRPLLWPLLLLLAWASHGQSTLGGTITDEAGRPISGASVLARPMPGGPIRAFALSSATGSYSLSLPAGMDTLWVEVSHLAYAPQGQRATGPAARLDWVLQAQVYELPEMVLSQPAVIRRGDTLVFDVKQLKKAEDENLEQVLARIPGITVEPNGRILYQDLPISKFYIEGLDLLEGRYALATRNLNIAAIRDIEILERHQPIRALDSLITPPNAAINLRLKSNLALVGEVEVGGGAAPALYTAKGSLFGFRRQQQSHLLGAANNIGEPQRHSFKNLYEDASLEQMLVSATALSPPFGVRGHNALDNREATGGLNLLRKAGTYGQFNLQAFAATDRLQYLGQRERTLRDAGQGVRFDELLRAVEMPRHWNGRLAYELNRPLLYLKASVEAEQDRTHIAVDNEVNGAASLEDLARDKLTLRWRGEAILRRGDRVYRLWSRVDYVEEDLALLLLPLDVVAGNPPAGQLDKARQDMQRQHLSSDTYTGALRRRGQLTAYFKAGLRLHRHHLGSGLASLDPEDRATPLGPLFANDMAQTLWAPYLEQDYTWARRHGEWKLHLPAAFHRLTLSDDLGGGQLRRGLPVLRPHLEYLPRQGGFSAQVSYHQDYNEDQLFYNGYLLRVNRQFDRQLFALNQRRAAELSLRHQGRDLRTGLYHSSHLDLSITQADLLSATVFDTLGQASLPVRASNVQRRASWQNRLEATPFPALQVKLEAGYTLAATPNSLNGRRLNILAHQARAESYLVYSLGQSVLSARPRVDLFANSLFGAPVWQMQLRWVFFQQLPGRWGSVHLGFNQYRTRIGPRTVDNHLFNLRYENKLPSQKLHLILLLNNLTDEDEFITFFQGGFFEELGRFQLRPRQFVLKLAKKF